MSHYPNWRLFLLAGALTIGRACFAQDIGVEPVVLAPSVEVAPVSFEDVEIQPIALTDEIQPVSWGEPCCNNYNVGCCNNCGPRDCGWFHDAWISQGYTANFDHPASNFNTPLTFNDRADEYQMNQLYLAMGKEVDAESCCWSLGGRVDLLYGSDYFFTMANGLELHTDGSRKWNGDGPRDGGNAALYGLAMPQLYGEVYAPIGNGLRVKFGHFYTIIGYESVMAPQNFFYSHAYTMQYGEPFTHTGVLGSYTFGQHFTVHAGITNGWDNFDNLNGQCSALIGAQYANDVSSLSYSFINGKEDINGLNNRFLQSIVYTRKLGQRWTYVFQSDLGIEDDGKLDESFNPDTAFWYGINQYLYLKYTDTVDLGVRLEWFRDEDNARVIAIPIEAFSKGGNYYELTLGANWRPCDFINVRPELRYDWSNVDLLGAQGPYDDFMKKQMWTASFDVIFKF
ncbi:porin [Blastopirellula sp. JC732]|uniref:Porin n=1 Tax=Blastopirellula sediminis TaxID=2894196 RepID=A0A9X1SIA4_9BACT|nr:porin [Blastopirellula sediminis]MCC9604621.1 porin [Blastopirellula sediminis]MCC9632080.1 porin [Blastopirellula sediminis]